MAERERKDYGPPPRIRHTYGKIFPDGSSALIERTRPLDDPNGTPIEESFGDEEPGKTAGDSHASPS